MHSEDFPPPLRDEAAHVFGCSDFVAESFARDAELWSDLQRHAALLQLRTTGGRSCWPGDLRPELSAPESEDGPYSTALEEHTLAGSIEDALAALSERERFVIERRFGIQ